MYFDIMCACIRLKQQVWCPADSSYCVVPGIDHHRRHHYSDLSGGYKNMLAIVLTIKLQYVVKPGRGGRGYLT